MTESCSFFHLNAIFNPFYFLALFFFSMLTKCKLCTLHVHRGHPVHTLENTVYQRTDLLPRADDSQDNYGKPKQQGENGSLGEYTNKQANTHKRHTVHVCMSDTCRAGSKLVIMHCSKGWHAWRNTQYNAVVSVFLDAAQQQMDYIPVKFKKHKITMESID